MIKKLLCLCLAMLLMVTPMVGCSGSEDSGAASSEATWSSHEKLTEVMNAIYKDLDNSTLADATDQVLKELFFLDPEDVEEYAIRYTDFRHGVADVCIVKPVKDKKKDVTASLLARKEAQEAACKNYDIHNSYAIAKNAEIYERGGYIIMLMLPDNDSAKKIIDEYLI